jgi:hypothetical protein
MIWLPVDQRQSNKARTVAPPLEYRSVFISLSHAGTNLY